MSLIHGQKRKQGGLANWPTCAKCAAPVRAYGREKLGPQRWLVWAKCHGKREEQKLKSPDAGWTEEQLAGATALLIFFLSDSRMFRC